MASARVDTADENTTKTADGFSSVQISEHGKELTLTLTEETYHLQQQERAEEIKLAWGQNTDTIKELCQTHLNPLNRKVIKARRYAKLPTSTNTPGPSRSITTYQLPEVKGIIPITNVTPLPKQIYWTKVGHNVATPDSKFLTHIPQVAEPAEPSGTSPEFVFKLIELYDGQVALDYSKHRLQLQSHLIRLVIKALTELVKDFGLGILSSERKSDAITRLTSIAGRAKRLMKDGLLAVEVDKVPSEVYAAITCTLKGTGTAKELQEWFIEKSRSHCDRPKGIEVYRDLLCKICCLYDCSRHKGLTGTSVTGSTTTNAATGDSWNSEIDDDNLDDGSECLTNNVSKLVKKCRTGKADMNGVVKNPALEIPNLTEPGTSSQMKAKAMKTLPTPTVVPNRCSHKGRCDENCSCVKNGVKCEKFCDCRRRNCNNRFRGCTCANKCKTKNCPCYRGFRECDPDLCKKCKSHESDPKERTCLNVSIQMGKGKPLRLAVSDVNGWGVFAGSDIHIKEYISEYTGEVISHSEADKRGFVYDARKHTFLFGLDENYTIDGTILGGKVRFMNSSLKPNCEPRKMRVNGELRIGFYAIKEIKKGDELFMNYHEEILKKLGLEDTIDD
ncbi:unnamed protein product [Orchesella dallaii]|uniref:[histone H3]-lysine(27) N-trimethyltransferase n=1 Tax=Orchesella dallaii TaxID=48710 RepID=A0ABP1R3J8_9HEXA